MGPSYSALIARDAVVMLPFRRVFHATSACAWLPESHSLPVANSHCEFGNCSRSCLTALHSPCVPPLSHVCRDVLLCPRSARSSVGLRGGLMMHFMRLGARVGVEGGRRKGKCGLVPQHDHQLLHPATDVCRAADYPEEQPCRRHLQLQQPHDIQPRNALDSGSFRCTHAQVH